MWVYRRICFWFCPSLGNKPFIHGAHSTVNNRQIQGSENSEHFTPRNKSLSHTHAHAQQTLSLADKFSFYLCDNSKWHSWQLFVLVLFIQWWNKIIWQYFLMIKNVFSVSSSCENHCSSQFIPFRMHMNSIILFYIQNEIPSENTQSNIFSQRKLFQKCMEIVCKFACNNRFTCLFIFLAVKIKFLFWLDWKHL